MRGILLSITGTEAMFADLGHFIALSIRDVVFWPVFIIVTQATIVGSQVIITATFSIVKQCHVLGCFPRVKVTFITTCLMALVVVFVWQRSILLAAAFLLFFGFIEGVYLSSALMKVLQGGSVSLVLSFIFMVIMYVWHYGTRKKYNFDLHNKVPLRWLLGLGPSLGIVRVPGIGLVYSELATGVPAIFSHFVTNLPAFHSERCLIGRICPRPYRMYKDIQRDDGDFENQLIQSVAEFIQMEAVEPTLSSSDRDTASFDGRMAVISTRTIQSSSCLIVSEQEDCGAFNSIQISKSLTLQSLRSSYDDENPQMRRRQVRFQLPPNPGMDPLVREELLDLIQAKEAGVAYIIGHSYVKVKRAHFRLLAMKRGYQESSSSGSLRPPQSKIRHNPEGDAHFLEDESTKVFARKVADHYSARMNQTLEEQGASPIIHLKKLNNCIESVLIQLYAHRGDAVLDLACGKEITSGSYVVHGRPCAIGIRCFSSSIIICCNFSTNPSSLYLPLCCNKNQSLNLPKTHALIWDLWWKSLEEEAAQSNLPKTLQASNRGLSGRYKEEGLVEKLQQMMMEEEKQRIPIAQGLPWTTYKPVSQRVAEKMGLIEQYREERERQQKLAKEEEIRRLRKELIPRAQPMPYFDRPFIPRRSMKHCTIPREPKFHKPPQHKKIKVEGQTDEVIFDHLHATAFQYTPLGRTILGPAQNIKMITKYNLQKYISTHYTAPRMVIAASGAVKHEDIVEQVKKLFTKLSTDPTIASELVAKEPAIFTGSEDDDDIPLAKFAVAFNGASWTDPDSIALVVMQSVLGSWNKNAGGGKHMGSELAQRVGINEIAENMMAFNTNYKDTGLFGVYAIAKPDCLDDLAYAIMYEMSKLCYRVSEADVTRACNQLKSSLLLHIDGTSPVAEDIGCQLLTYRRRIPFVELFARIDAVDSSTVKRVANRFIFDQDVAMGPIQGLPNYNWFRRRTYWLRH
ncbi:unnamed protein product [Camellia sinensis]